MLVLSEIKNNIKKQANKFRVEKVYFCTNADKLKICFTVNFHIKYGVFHV